MSASKLVRPDIEFKDSYLTALGEYHAEERYLALSSVEIAANFEAFVTRLRTDRGIPHRPYQSWVEPVPETVLWMVRDRDYLGTICIRHRLNWHLEKWGGHIHFVIRPSQRQKGYGKKALQKAIPFANYLGIDRALLTVGAENVPAIRIIKFCGAVFADETEETDIFPARQRYWLDCT